MRIKERVRLLDLAPTVLDILEIKPHQNMMGKSVLNLFSGRELDTELPEYFVAETNWQNVDKISVYSDKWKYIENRDNWDDVNEIELQDVGTKENGRLTDKISLYPDTARIFKTFLSRWEAKFSKVRATQPISKLSEREIEQLKSLGYIK
jgi:arylsulfatase A-like enzyme